MQRLNAKCEKCFDQNHLNMLFAIRYDVGTTNSGNNTNKKKDTSPAIWQIGVRIYCFTMLHGKQYRKVYNMYEFLKFYRSFWQILEASEASTSNNSGDQNFTDFTRDEDFMKISIFNESCCLEDGRCIICFDNSPDTVLPCTHAYCSNCISTFQRVNQKWCPLCRLPLKENEEWLMTEKPSKEAINMYLVDGNNEQEEQQQQSTSSNLQEQPAGEPV